MDVTIGKYQPAGEIEVSVPASKSELNRALVLAALSPSPVLLRAGRLCEDTRTMVGCLRALGVGVEERADGLMVSGRGGNFDRKAELNVQSAGTVARFLPAVLAFCGGEYRFLASEQMKRRPMGLLAALEEAGVFFDYEGDAHALPFTMRSEGIRSEFFTADTTESTQYASALLLAASAFPPFTLRLTGKRTQGSYLELTRSVLRKFGVPTQRSGDEIKVGKRLFVPDAVTVEADLSGACYFFAAALLCRARILVRGATLQTAQGDLRFLQLLAARGLKLTETAEGVLADGSEVTSFEGFHEDFGNFSDQALTAAALAPFASTPSVIRNIGHIRRQESDRIAAACANLRALGVPVKADGDDLLIALAPVKSAVLDSFGDHRVAMAFALAGLRVGVVIKGAECCKKTFDNYFDLLRELIGR